MTVILAGTWAILLLLSMIFFLFGGNEQTTRVLFFPRYRTADCVGEERVLPVKETTEQEIELLLKEILLGPFDVNSVSVVPRDVQLRTVMLRGNRLFVDFSEDIVFQDKYLIVVNKPAMIDTQPTHARYKGTLFEALQMYLQDPFRPHQKPVIGMVQRLDRSTSGLIVFSIHPQTHKKMTELFKTGMVDKTYSALVSGQPDSTAGEIRSMLARSRRENRVHTVSAGGKQAITHYRIHMQLNNSALLEVQILTGRSHQIRAHMSELGCPLLGDQRYGGPITLDGMFFNRPLLHAQRLKFSHPLTAQLLDFNVPMPADMCQALQFLKGD